jgi:multicomponent Na+:H+ antiporter subunit C
MAGHWVTWMIVLVLLIGLYTLIAHDNLIKKVMGLNIFQSGVVLLYVSMGTVTGGTPPVLLEPTAGLAVPVIYSNPVPHVLMLTAIVVGVATTALALAIVVRIQGAYGTIEEDEIGAIEMRHDEAQSQA